MAEDIWQNLPYPVAEASVFERGWPTVPASWRDTSLEAPVGEILALRAQVNRQLEACRKQGGRPPAGAGANDAASETPSETPTGIGASLEAQVQLELAPGEDTAALRQALALLEASPHASVDNLADWLLVSAVRFGGQAPGALLAEASDNGVTVRIARAEGSKCERCWHYETDGAEHQLSATVTGQICGRCRSTLEG
jgi:isoleucyl-tRNA synthetase